MNNPVAAFFFGALCAIIIATLVSTDNENKLKHFESRVDGVEKRIDTGTDNLARLSRQFENVIAPGRKCYQKEPPKELPTD